MSWGWQWRLLQAICDRSKIGNHLMVGQFLKKWFDYLKMIIFGPYGVDKTTLVRVRRGCHCCCCCCCGLVLFRVWWSLISCWCSLIVTELPGSLHHSLVLNWPETKCSQHPIRMAMSLAQNKLTWLVAWESYDWVCSSQFIESVRARFWSVQSMQSWNLILELAPLGTGPRVVATKGQVLEFPCNCIIWFKKKLPNKPW